MSEIKRLRVFLSSPGDVLAARDLAREVVEKLQKQHQFRNALLQVVSWDDPDRPLALDAYHTPQQNIDRGLPMPSACDVVVVILWSRIGTPVAHAGREYLSGTHYEYENALGAQPRPRIFVYRCTAPPEDAWKDVKFGETPEQQRAQLVRLEEFLSRFHNTDGTAAGTLMSFGSISQFGGMLRAHLDVALQEKLEQWRTGQGDLGIALSFRRKLTEFREEYLASETRPVPFGGRDAELEQLRRWLWSEEGPSRLLLTAPAGRGKSALLVRWLEQLQADEAAGKCDWQIAFMPISIRVGTNRPEEFYQGLALRLSEISGLTLDETAQRDADYFKASVRKQLEYIATKGMKVLVVIDGIDEALEGTFDAGVIPKQPPLTLRVLISARWQVRHNDAKGWLRSLEWDHDTRVQTMELEKLDPHCIADVLVGLGAPMDIVTHEPGLVEKLAKLTEGEPLLVRFYSADLWDRAVVGARITVADLDTLVPGFASYFERWVKHQEQLWKQEGMAIDGEQVDRVLMILAFALGRLPEVDLLALMKEVERSLSAGFVERLPKALRWFVKGEDKGNAAAAMREVHGQMSLGFGDRLLRPLRRFVMGDGKADTGFVLSHPKIGDYLRGERFHAVEKPVRRTFADWGRRHLAGLNSGEIVPKDASRYLLLYLPKHLEMTDAPASDFMAMVDDGWRLAWEDLDGGPRGFCDAVRYAWARVRKDGQGADWGAQWRCALTLSSIRSLGRNMPGELLAASVRRGALSPSQAVHYARLKGPGEAAEDLARITVAATGLGPVAGELIEETLACAMSAGSDREKGHCIDGAAKVFLTASGVPEELRQSFVQACVRQASALPDTSARATTLANLVPFMNEAQVELALKAAREIGDAKERIKVLGVVRSGPTGGSARDAIETPVPNVARAIERDIADAMMAAVESLSGSDRGEALRSAVPHLSAELFDDAVAKANAIGADYSRGETLEALAKRAPDGQPLMSILKALGQERNKGLRGKVLEGLGPRMGERHKEDAFRLAVSIEGGSDRRESLGAVAHCLDARQLQEAIQSIKGIDDDLQSLKIVAALLPRLEPRAKRDAVSRALGSVRALAVPRQQTEGLTILLSVLEGEERRSVAKEAVGCALQINDTHGCVWALTNLIPEVQDRTVRQRAIGKAEEAAQSTDDKMERAGWLLMIARHLPPERHAAIVAEAHEALARGSSPEHHAYFVLHQLFKHHLAQGELDAAVQAARSSDIDRTRDLLEVLGARPAAELKDELIQEILEHVGAETLIELKPHLAEARWKSEIDELLESVSSHDEDGYPSDGLVSTLEALAPHFDAEQTARGLGLARSLDYDWERAGVLAALAAAQRGSDKEDLISEAQKCAEAIKDGKDRVPVLLRLAQAAGGRLQRRHELLQAAISSARGIAAAPDRASVLAGIAGLVDGQERAELIDAVIEAAAESPRKEAYEILVSLKTDLPPAVLAGACKAVHDVSKWYP